MSRKSKRIKRRAGWRPPASGRKPIDRIGGHDVAVSAEELQMFHRQFESHLYVANNAKPPGCIFAGS